jgi:hypothetical protein
LFCTEHICKPTETQFKSNMYRLWYSKEESIDIGL